MTGNANGDPRSAGYIANLSYWPWQNLQLAAQYTGIYTLQWRLNQLRWLRVATRAPTIRFIWTRNSFSDTHVEQFTNHKCKGENAMRYKDSIHD